MTETIIFHNTRRYTELRDFLIEKMQSQPIKDDGWEYFIHDGNIGKTLYFTQKTEAFNKGYAEINPVSRCLIKVFSEKAAGAVKNLVEGYRGVVLIEIVD